MLNNIRFDLSDYLIHFFRDVDMDMDRSNFFDMPEHMGWHSLTEDSFYPAIFMLRAALRNGRLWATWSYRSGARTIYGPDPAVCFTDMPIAAFVEASRARSERGEAMGEVALVFPKSKMRRLGARTVIYGLSDDSIYPPKPNGRGPREFSEDVLPLDEQYRYVTDSYPIDWSHEREWRWPYRNSQGEWNEEPPSDWSDIPGLDFYAERISGIGVIVKTREQANLVINDMLALVDADLVQDHVFSFVLVTDELPSLKSIRDHEDLEIALSDASIDLDQYYRVNRNKRDEVDQQFADAVQALENNAPPPKYGQVGGCWLWLHDGSSELARILLKTKRLIVSNNGRYLAKLNEFSDSRSLEEREEMTERLSAVIQEQFGVSCGYFSVVGSDDPDEVPFNAQDHELTIPFYNINWCDD